MGIRILSSGEATKGFDARRSARRREYVYYVHNGKEFPVVFWDKVLHVPERLDLKKMSAAAKLFKGKHNFVNFCSKDKGQKYLFRSIYSIRVKKGRTVWGSVISIRVTADSFLYRMVRYIVGALLDVGRGRMRTEVLKKLIKGEAVKMNMTVAPSCGLYLSNVEYGVKS